MEEPVGDDEVEARGPELVDHPGIDGATEESGARGKPPLGRAHVALVHVDAGVLDARWQRGHEVCGAATDVQDAIAGPRADVFFREDPPFARPDDCVEPPEHDRQVEEAPRVEAPAVRHAGFRPITVQLYRRRWCRRTSTKPASVSSCSASARE